MIFDRAWREGRTKHRIAALRTPQIGEGGQVRGSNLRAKTNPKNSALPSDDGYCNTHTDYATQVLEVYAMLEATTPYGAEQTKSIYGYRISFLAGEGIRISADTPALQEWIEGWLRTQGMSGRMLTDLVGDSEVVGQVLWTMDEQGELTAWPSFIGAAREPAWWPVYEGLKLTGINQRDAGGNYVPWLQVDRDRFVFVRTGGHGNVARQPAPSTKLGACIDSLKNYDRAVRQARELNSKAIRQSPTIELGDQAATDEQEVLDDMSRRDWQMGDVVVTRGKYHVESSDSGPVATLQLEVAMIVKDLSSVSGVPPHWLGYTDLLANRATANSLFEAIAASTHIERLSWEHGLNELIRLARMVVPGAPAGEFTVTMPLLSYQQFALRNDSLIALLKENVIGREDVRGQLPFDAQGPDAEDEAMRQQDQQTAQQSRQPREGRGDQN